MDGGEKVGLGVKGTRSQANDEVVGMGSWKRSEQDKNARFWRGGEIPTLEHEFWLSAGQSSPEEQQKPKLKKGGIPPVLSSSESLSFSSYTNQAKDSEDCKFEIPIRVIDGILDVLFEKPVATDCSNRYI